MESWIVFAVQVALSLLTLSVGILSLVWLRSRARGEREIKLLLERLVAAYQQIRGPAPVPLPVRARQGGKAPAPTPLDALTDSRRAAGLTMEIALPVIQRRVVSVTREEDDGAQTRPTRDDIAPSRPLAVQVGAEVVDLDPDTVARIEALQQYVNDGRHDGTMLNRLIDAGFAVVGEATREIGDHAVASNDIAPMTPVTPTRPTGG